MLGRKNNENILNINLDAEWTQFLENIKVILCDLYEEYEKNSNQKSMLN